MIGALNLSDNFAQKLVEIILHRHKDPLDIAQTTVILPTKRACRSLKDMFVRHCENAPLLLPQMRALYEIDELADDIPQAISSVERLFLLARLCQKKPNIDSLDKALKIAKSLADLLDEFYLNEVDPKSLSELVPEQSLAEHWQESLKFLNILTDVWPAILAEKGVIDEKERQILLIKRLTRQILKAPQNSFFIIAGLGGEVPAVRKMIKQVGDKSNVLVLLDGLNTEIDEEEVKNLNENHYQYPLIKLLNTLNKTPQDVQMLSTYETPQESLIKKAFVPPELTYDWCVDGQNKKLSHNVVQNVGYIECETAAEEAAAIAVLLREVLETPEKTAALVTSDRNLARRVIAEMKRWGVELDDSAGTPLNHTPTGIFLSLIADWALAQTGNALLALLKHPLCADRQMPADLRITIRKAEVSARKRHEKLDVSLQTEITDFLRLFIDNTPVAFQEILNRHLTIAEELATSADKSGLERLWQTDDGEEAYRFFAALQEYSELIGEIKPESYPQTLTFLMSFISVRPKYGTHRRLDILGPIESRLSHPDVCIIGGLNEGGFPTLPDTGPWLSRLMRKKIHLPSPELAFATQSMDFAHAFCAPEVFLTRSLKTDGSPTIPSRFLSRVQAVLDASKIPFDPIRPALARALDKPDDFEKIERPTPCPPKEIRPKELPVTGIRNLISNPYAVYAQYVLKLSALDKLEHFNEGSAYGTALHNAFFQTELKKGVEKQALVESILSELKKCGCNEATLAFYRAKIEKSADFFAKTQNERTSNTLDAQKETKGAINITLKDGTVFTLTGKADRIDSLNDNSYEIIDYKTGSVPDKKQIEEGFEPQLPLEALILREGGFNDLPAAQDIHLSYWKINGKGSGGEVTSVSDVNMLIDEARAGVQRLLNAYQNDTRPYEAHLKDVAYDNYEHLARVKEWLTEDE